MGVLKMKKTLLAVALARAQAQLKALEDRLAELQAAPPKSP